MLAYYRFPHYHWVERQHIGSHRQAVNWRRSNGAHFAHPTKCHLQRPRDRSCGHRKYMHVGLKLFQAFLVGDAKMLLLVYHQQVEGAKTDRLGQKSMSADDDVERSVSEPRLVRCGFFAPHQPRKLANPYRHAREPAKRGHGLHGSKPSVSFRENPWRNHWPITPASPVGSGTASAEPSMRTTDPTTARGLAGSHRPRSRGGRLRRHGRRPRW